MVGPPPRHRPRVPVAAGRDGGARARPSARRLDAGAAPHGGSGNVGLARRSRACWLQQNCRSWLQSRLPAGGHPGAGAQVGGSHLRRPRPPAWPCARLGGRTQAAPRPGARTGSPNPRGSLSGNPGRTSRGPRGRNSWWPRPGRARPDAALPALPRGTRSTLGWGSRNAPDGGPSGTGGPRGSGCHCACGPTVHPPAGCPPRKSAHPWPSADWWRAGSPSAAGSPSPCIRPSGPSPPWLPRTCCAAAAGLRGHAGGPWWLKAGRASFLRAGQKSAQGWGKSALERGQLTVWGWVGVLPCAGSELRGEEMEARAGSQDLRRRSWFGPWACVTSEPRRPLRRTKLHLAEWRCRTLPATCPSGVRGKRSLSMFQCISAFFQVP